MKLNDQTKRTSRNSYPETELKGGVLLFQLPDRNLENCWTGTDGHG